MTTTDNDHTDGNEEKKPRRRRGRAASALKQSIMDIGQGIDEGTDKMADVFTDDSAEGKTARGEKLKKETVAMVKDIASHVKSNMKETSVNDVVCETSYGTGALFRKLRDADYAGLLRHTCYAAGRYSRMTKDALWGKG